MARVDDIRQYWDRKARDLRADPAATMKDLVLRTLEIEAIGSRLRPDDDLLDVGTGNAYGPIQWSLLCRRIRATDYSEEMVSVAREAVAESGAGNITVEAADVLDLSCYAGGFSAVSSVRCLINLTAAETQRRALGELARALRPGGRLFLVEGLEETFTVMNRAREVVGLAAIPLNWHNRLFRRADLEQWLSEDMEIEEVVDFGEYYFVSRVVHPLAVAPEEPRFEGRLNLTARDLWRSGVARGRFSDLSTLVLYVAVRR